MTIRVVLADDHRMLREGLVYALEEHGFDVVGEAGDGEQAILRADQLDPDVILMDVTMPGIDGLEATREIHNRRPHIKIIMLTMHADNDVLTGAIRAGAAGYLLKDCSTQEIANAITMAESGEPVLSPELARSMLAEVQRARDTASAALEERLITKREERVLQLVVDGCSTTEVAARLYISEKTVKNHLGSIYAKLDAQDRTQAALTAVRLGIVNLRSDHRT